MKEKGYAHWLTPNVGAEDTHGFTALPGEYRDLSSDLSCSDEDQIGYTAVFWTSDVSESYPDIAAYARGITYDGAGINDPRSSFYKNSGYSVRCVKD